MCRAETVGKFRPQYLGGGHSARRSRPADNSSQVGSIRIGVPQMRIDLLSSVEAGLAEGGSGARSVSARVSCERGRGRGMAIALTALILSAASVEASASDPFLSRDEANQHFVPSCPGNRSRHVACDPRCAAQTALAVERHSAWAVDAIAMRTVRMMGTLMISARYACSRSKNSVKWS